MSRLIDLTGRTFGRWTVIERASDRTRHRYWKCRCSCGSVKEVEGGGLNAKISKSCGCLSTENHLTHGRTGSKSYQNWAVMLQRITNPKNPRFSSYGGRGITVCPTWNAERALTTSVMQRFARNNQKGVAKC